MIQRYPRSYAVDVARGFCLIIMTIDHLPRNILGRFSNVTFGPFGFFTGASGFIFLSGLVSAWAYGSVLREHGTAAAWRRALGRVKQLYLINTSLFLLILAGISLRILRGSQWLSEFAPFFNEPWKALYEGLLLLYRPGYLSILPMYIFFLLILIPALAAIRASHWWIVMGVSMLAWLWLQVWPFPASNSLSPLAYQVLFVSGLMVGSIPNVEARLYSPRVSAIAGASLVLAAILFLLRLTLGLFRSSQVDLPDWQRLIDLENNGPLRLANFALFALGAAYIWPRIPMQLRHSPLPRWCAYLGQHSLHVFAWSVLLTYVSMALIPPSPTRLWGAIDLILTVSSLVIPARLHSVLSRRDQMQLTERGNMAPRNQGT